MSVQQPINTNIDTNDFRKALGSFTTGVTVVTTRNEEFGDIGLTANSFNSVSLTPPMVLWSLAKSANSLQAFKDADYFAVHILSEDQQDISNQFAQRGQDKFAGLNVERGPDNVPLLEACAARFICRTAYQYEGGDHIIFVGEVVDFGHYNCDPLLFHGGQYGLLKKDQDVSAPNVTAAPDDSLGYLLRLSYQSIMLPLAKELEKRDLDLAQHFFLAHVARNNGQSLSDILDKLAESNTMPSDENIDELFECEYLSEDQGIISLTEKGMALRIELASIYKSIESSSLESMGYEKAQTLKVMLQEFISSMNSFS